jgi:hypothetical protein
LRHLLIKRDVKTLKMIKSYFIKIEVNDRDLQGCFAGSKGSMWWGMVKFGIINYGKC